MDTSQKDDSLDILDISLDISRSDVSPVLLEIWYFASSSINRIYDLSSSSNGAKGEKWTIQ
jgi:hypothetical protein